MLKEKAVFYYYEQGKNCAEALLLAAADVYSFSVSDSELTLFAGFGGGMGCGSTCGSLTGAIAILGKLFGTKEDFRDLCGAFVSKFEKTFGAIDCTTLAAKHKTEERRCTSVVEITAEILSDYIDTLNGKKNTLTDENGCTLTDEQIKWAKGFGFLHHKGTNCFNARVITRNGRITAEESITIAEAAKLYGDGHMMFTTRLTVEVSGIPFDKIAEFQDFLAKDGLITGGTGSKVRPVVSCKGTTCQYGLYDTYELSDEIHKRFYLGYHEVSLPHKFKIALGGCPNNCVKPNLNDLGIIGAKIPSYLEEKCRGCKVCQIEKSCPVKAAKLQDGKLVIDKELCNDCGRCVNKCPFHCADEAVYGWKIYIGGRWGKKMAHGQMLEKVFTDKQELFDAVEKAILLFRSEGIPGERFADTIDRIGFEKAQNLILGNELLEKKTEILGITVKGGASC